MTQSKLSLDVILNMHFLMAQRVDPTIAGKWRDCDVWIGGKRKIFVSVSLISEDVNNLLTDMGVSSDLPIEDLERFVKECHIRYEGIHPFRDFNGRSGRMIMNWHRMKLGLPIHIIHADIGIGGDEQRSYYLWFKD